MTPDVSTDLLNAEPEASVPPRQVLSHPAISNGLRLVLSALFLLLICNQHCFYEQDQLAKAAQVMALAKEPNLLNFPAVTDYYRKNLFSAYYFAADIFQQATRLPPLQSMNLLSVLCGTLTFTMMPVLTRRLFGVSEWLTWLVMLGTPILALTFTYGNETAFALVCVVTAAFFLSLESTVALVFAAIFFGLAIFARTDYLFLGLALSLLTLKREGGSISWPRSLKRLLVFCGSAAIFGAAYLAVFLRGIPSATLFEYHTNLKLFFAFLLYGPGYITMLLGLTGVYVCLASRRWKFFLLLPILVQSLPYLNRLTSPKYIIPAYLALLIFAVVGLEEVRKRSIVLCAVILAFPWFFSITPFGVFGPSKSAIWYLPSDAGAIPVGGYLSFYRQVKLGFFQERYDQELEQVGEGMTLVEKQPATSDLVGFFNPQTLRFWATRHGRWDIPPDHMSFWDTDSLKDVAHRPKFMIKMSYLYPFKLPAELRSQLDSFYQVPAASSRGLKRSILFPT
ncbi:MAG: hypothetical protein QM796_09800 [Chthoniobacteraceae bacterium]